MARSAMIAAVYDSRPGQVQSRLSSWGSAFTTILTDTTVVDAASITNPETQITAASRTSVNRLGLGTSLQLAARYARAITSASVHLEVKVFGRAIIENVAGPWHRLINALGDSSVVITLDPTYDSDDGATWKYTLLREEHWWDCQAFDEFVVGVEQAATVVGGSMSTAEIMARFV